jgi:hypothetical protein
MNQKTAKLIQSYASKTSAKARQLKREWQALSRVEKTRRRVTMKEAIR